mmetsp:Transcript_34811/g.103400  ORF Transcript_34811/g.103400 Transcript_34811/m.103400 type:complete len:136 (-) Transcript_34811:57-464(-)
MPRLGRHLQKASYRSPGKASCTKWSRLIDSIGRWLRSCVVVCVVVVCVVVCTVPWWSFGVVLVGDEAAPDPAGDGLGLGPDGKGQGIDTWGMLRLGHEGPGDDASSHPPSFSQQKASFACPHCAWSPAKQSYEAS